MTRVLRLTLFAQNIVEAILDGRRGPEESLERVLEPFPVDWAEQQVHLDQATQPAQTCLSSGAKMPQRGPPLRAFATPAKSCDG